MKLELVSIRTDTKQPLDGLYYEPSDCEIRGSVLLFHGNCMNFYVGAPRFLPPVLTKLGLACLAFNRRGHDILSTRDSRVPEGAAFQTSNEMVADNRFAAEWLAREKGHRAPIIIGHSNGGMLAAQHCADHPDTPGLVLLSAHAGGRSVIETASKTGLLAGDQFDVISAQAKALVADGRGEEMILLPGWWRIITAKSFVDILDGLPDILENAPRIKCPSLYLRGDQEPPQLYPIEEFASRAAGPCDTLVADNCDHFYNGVEDQIATAVASWLETSVLGSNR
ncbi:alpha/beta hydrolase [Pseudomonas yamanorum]|uniref:Alpha/beta hydrolase n=1 Tax=Pseudomonas yamanorum TaxID=515393 RepID=A0A7Y8FES3_9PSED|nr:alpha/beta fold hydrolase [Pseudomonas yamanorum]NWE77779.1 alpha/beta hydrolase [Pseudomonas yamanorum]